MAGGGAAGCHAPEVDGELTGDRNDDFLFAGAAARGAEQRFAPGLAAIGRKAHRVDAVPAVEGDTSNRNGPTHRKRRALGKVGDKRADILPGDGLCLSSRGTGFDTCARVIRDSVGGADEVAGVVLIQNGDLIQMFHPVRPVVARDD